MNTINTNNNNRSINSTLNTERPSLHFNHISMPSNKLRQTSYRKTNPGNSNPYTHLSINTFNNNRRYISGNQCQKMTNPDTYEELPNLYKFKRELFANLKPVKGKRGKIGIPLVLSMYELGPMWYKLFTELGFEVVFSGFSSRSLYELGQFSIPSETICYGGKFMDGDIMKFINEGIDTIFYPCLTMNVDEKASDNHYNCPVVAYYSETINRRKGKNR